MALIIAIFSMVYIGVFASYGARASALHRRQHRARRRGAARAARPSHQRHRGGGDDPGAEYMALFVFVRELGRNSGIQINYIVAAAVAFAVGGLGRIRLAVVAVIAIGLVLHIAAWFLFPPERALIVADPSLLANL